MFALIVLRVSVRVSVCVDCLEFAAFCDRGRHDGRGFTPLDVLGLSSVGLSSKAGRTIGFMGIGFKAVYRRFARVVVSARMAPP